MPTFEMTSTDGGGVYHVDAPDEQQALAAFSALHGDGGNAPDKYQQAAIDEAASNPAIDEGAGYTRRLAHGATLGADSTILAAAETPFEMVKHGTWSPAEGYDYAKAREDRIMDESRKNTGGLGTLTEMLGGAVTGGNVTGGVGALTRDVPGLVSMGGRAGDLVTTGGRGLSFGSGLAPDAGLIARSAASAGDAAALGGVSGFNEGNGIGERLENAAKGAGIGLAAGGAFPIVGAIAKGVTAPITSNLRALVNPEGYAASQVARAVHESGQTPQELGQAVAAANAEGTPLTLADALGNPGQRMLSTVTRAPGGGRTAAVDFLEARQAGQGRRVANALAEGFDSRMTPDALEAGMTASRGAQADAEYGAVRNDAGPVDVTPVIRHIDETLGPAADQMLANPGSAAPNDTAEAALLGVRNRLSRINPDDFQSVQRIRGDLADSVQAAVRAGAGNKARLLGGALRQLDASLENSSNGFRQANANFSQASRDIDAIGQGRNAAMRGRTEDTIPAFNDLGPRGQQAFRAGYADPLIASTQGAAHGVNKIRSLTSDAFRDEAAAIAPRNAPMQRRLANENTMFQTRNHALGGSRTADNLADEAAMGVDPHLIGHVISHNYAGAMRHVISAGHTALTGNTAPVRAAVGRMLLDRGVNPQNLQTAIGQTIARIQFMQNLARSVGRAGAGALAVARPGQS